METGAHLTAEQQADVDALRERSATTRRATVPALEELLYSPIPVLDHGFVRVVDYMGDDAAIVQAARVSYGAGTKRIHDDVGLINYLMRHRHTSPFEMCEIKLHLKMPIFVARQHVRHRMAALNEVSGRYSVLDREFYFPDEEHLATQSTANRQGRGDVLAPERARAVLKLLMDDAELAYGHYEELLSGAPDEPGSGLARELARMSLSVNLYTQMYWKIDLHNLLHYLSLRAHAHSQYEIRVFADAIQGVVKAWVPLTHDAFVDHRQNAVTLSGKAVAVVRQLLAGQPVTRAASGMSAGEWREVMESLGRSAD